MENTNALKFIVFRRVARARWKTPVGIVMLVSGISLAIAGVITFALAVKVAPKNELGPLLPGIFMIMVALIIGIIGIIILSEGKRQPGTIIFSNDKISYNCQNEMIDFLPGQITSAHQNGNIVSIVFQGKTLEVAADQASMIVQNINAFISAHQAAQAVSAAPAAAPAHSSISADEIRKYKQLVDDGVISQEQFEEIVRKNT